MSREFQRAIAAEIRAEVARQGLSRTRIGAAVGMDPKSWSNYFVNVSRDVPLPALSAVCNELGVSLSEVIRRAERAEAQPVPSLTGLADALAADVGDPDLDALREQKRNRKAR